MNAIIPDIDTLKKVVKINATLPDEAINPYIDDAMDIYLNNGVLERTVNKTKAIKRQMFNRANITLLGNKLISLNT